jgi:hypothetical protein
MKRTIEMGAVAALGFILPGGAITIALNWCLRSIING